MFSIFIHIHAYLQNEMPTLDARYYRCFSTTEQNKISRCIYINLQKVLPLGIIINFIHYSANFCNISFRKTDILAYLLET
jgi:hypothetical protein